MTQIKPIQRNLYYSQSELQRIFKLSVKRIKSIIEENKIPVVENEITMPYVGGDGSYKFTTKYVLITDWNKAINQ